MPSRTFPGTVRVLLEAHIREQRCTRRLVIPDRLIDDALLVASELLNNAIAATPFAEVTFKATLEWRALWVGVWDSSRASPRPTRVPAELNSVVPDGNALDDGYESEDIGGWGLPIVMSLCPDGDRDITWTREPDGKWTWARFRF
ncbi:ATP-binding protein [Actinomadura sp. SCN-SB]|uniref:ATP-binding protein n=1 Tax=Actinomadura sp. SCN-SB TaxID=3373092 RepID=UPI003750DC7D